MQWTGNWERWPNVLLVQSTRSASHPAPNSFPERCHWGADPWFHWEWRGSGSSVGCNSPRQSRSYGQAQQWLLPTRVMLAADPVTHTRAGGEHNCFWKNPTELGSNVSRTPFPPFAWLISVHLSQFEYHFLREAVLISATPMGHSLIWYPVVFIQSTFLILWLCIYLCAHMLNVFPLALD